jgi:hypothetical protein
MAPLLKAKRWRQTGTRLQCMYASWSGQLKRLTEIIRTSHQRRGRSSGRWYHRLRCRGVSRSDKMKIILRYEDWMYRATSGCERSQIVVLKIVEWSGLEREVVHVSTSWNMSVITRLRGSQMHPCTKCHRNVMTKIVLTLAYARAHLKGFVGIWTNRYRMCEFSIDADAFFKDVHEWTSIWTPSFLSDICTRIYIIVNIGRAIYSDKQELLEMIPTTPRKSWKRSLQFIKEASLRIMWIHWSKWTEDMWKNSEALQMLKDGGDVRCHHLQGGLLFFEGLKLVNVILETRMNCVLEVDHVCTTLASWKEPVCNGFLRFTCREA